MEKEFQDAIDASVQKIKDELSASAKSLVDVQIKEALSAKKEAEVKAAQELDGKFKSLGEVFCSVMNIRRDSTPDNRLTYVDSKGAICKPGVNAHGKATMTEGTDSTGGFLVPHEYRSILETEALESSAFLGGCFTVPMSSDTLSYPRINETNRTSTVRGGIVGYWQGEGSTYQESEPTFGEIRLKANKLMGYTKITEELMYDSGVSMDPFIRKEFADAWAWFKDIAILRGTGSGQPLGILNAPALVTVTRGDTDDTMLQDIINIWSRVSVASRAKAIWFMNHENLPKMILNMHSGNTVTNAYGAPLLWQQNIYDPIKSQIFGRPVVFTEKMSAQGTVGDVGCFDLSKYLIGTRQGLTIDLSNQVYWTTGHIAFRFTERLDGQPMVASAITPYKGSATLSPFVTLSDAS
jgi:HK97 family phage major capsid protein